MNVTRTISIPAAIGGVDGVYFEDAFWARSFFCVTAAANFRVQIGQGTPVDASTAVSFVMPEGARPLLLLNNTAAAIAVTFVLSDAAFISQPALLSSQILVADTQSQSQLPATTGLFTYTGTRTVAGAVRQRKFIEIDLTNFTANVILVREGLTVAGRILGRLKNNTNRRFDLSDDLCLHNNTGDACTVSVYEVF